MCIIFTVNITTWDTVSKQGITSDAKRATNVRKSIEAQNEEKLVTLKRRIEKRFVFQLWVTRRIQKIELKSVLMLPAAVESAESIYEIQIQVHTINVCGNICKLANCKHENAFDSSKDLKIPQSTTSVALRRRTYPNDVATSWNYFASVIAGQFAN